MPRKSRAAGAIDPRTFLYVLEPKFEGNGLPWMKNGWCREYPAHWWDTYDASAERPVEERIQIAHNQDKARKICGVCPVRGDCLGFAVETGQPANIWGGMNPVQRNKYKREKANA